GADGEVGAMYLSARRPGGSHVGGLRGVVAAMPAAETGPGHVDIVLLRAPRVAVCVDKFLVVGDRRVGVSGDDSKRERPVRLKRDVCWRMEERSAKFLVGFGHNDRIRGCDGV